LYQHPIKKKYNEYNDIIINIYSEKKTYFVIRKSIIIGIKFVCHPAVFYENPFINSIMKSLLCACREIIRYIIITKKDLDI